MLRDLTVIIFAMCKQESFGRKWVYCCPVSAYLCSPDAQCVPNRWNKVTLLLLLLALSFPRASLFVFGRWYSFLFSIWERFPFLFIRALCLQCFLEHGTPFSFWKTKFEFCPRITMGHSVTGTGSASFQCVVFRTSGNQQLEYNSTSMVRHWSVVKLQRILRCSSIACLYELFKCRLKFIIVLAGWSKFLLVI
jgi:hypothetical protein